MGLFVEGEPGGRNFGRQRSVGGIVPSEATAVREPHRGARQSLVHANTTEANAPEPRNRSLRVTGLPETPAQNRQKLVDEELRYHILGGPQGYVSKYALCSCVSSITVRNKPFDRY